MSTKFRAATARTFAALRIRNYRLYFISQVISFSGTWMQSIAMSWLVLQLTGSGTALGTVLAMQFLPTLFLGPVGGIVADRFDKRRLLIVTQTAAGLLALVLGILTVTDTIELWMLYLLAAGLGTVAAVDNPARQTFVLEMVGPGDLANAVTLNSVMVNSARVIGPALGGVLIATVGIGECFLFNAASYVAVVLALCFLHRDALHPASRAARSRGQLREGFDHVRHEPSLRTPLVMAVLIGLFTMEFNVTLPLLANHVFATGASGLAILSAMMGVGGCIGGLAIAARGETTPRRLVFMTALFGASMTALAFAPSPIVAYLVTLVVGVGSIGTLSSTNVLLQLNARPHMRGRVMALFSVAVIGTTPIGGPIVGWVGDHVGARAAVLVGAAAAAAAAVYGWRRLGETSDGQGLRTIAYAGGVAPVVDAGPPAGVMSD